VDLPAEPAPARDEFPTASRSYPARTVTYVVSSTLSEPLAWNNSKLLGADLVAEVTRLKGQDEPPILVLDAVRRW
jgi:hypothetical protein